MIALTHRCRKVVNINTKGSCRNRRRQKEDDKRIDLFKATLKRTSQYNQRVARTKSMEQLKRCCRILHTKHDIPYYQLMLGEEL
jgi:hypothetical protein